MFHIRDISSFHGQKKNIQQGCNQIIHQYHGKFSFHPYNERHIQIKFVGRGN